MKSFARIVLILSAGTALGAMVFFTAVVPEAVFGTLSEDTAGRLLSVIFTPYYTLTSILCAIAFLASFLSFADVGRLYARAVQILFGLATAILFVSWFWLLPTMNRIRLEIGSFAHSESPLVGRFFLYHGISMLLDITAMLLMTAGLSLFGGRIKDKGEMRVERRR